MPTHDAHAEILTALGRLDEKVDGINARLDTLNGKVARHEQELRGFESREHSRNAVEAALKEHGKPLQEFWWKIAAAVSTAGALFLVGLLSQVYRSAA